MSSHRLVEAIDLAGLPAGSFVIEIGSVREDSALPSSVYLSQTAKQHGLGFRTVDASPASWRLAASHVGDEAVCGDGAAFLAACPGRIAVLVLDSFDYPLTAAHAESIKQRAGGFYGDMDAETMRQRSARVHLEQFLVALPKLTVPGWLIVDDTYRTSSWARRVVRPFHGKGGSLVPWALAHGFRIVKEDGKGVLLTHGGSWLSRLRQRYVSEARWCAAR